MIRFVISFILICCTVQPLNAASIALGDLLQRYREKGYALIYSTGLVDDAKIVEWDNEISIDSLRVILQSAGLELNRINRRTWSIDRLDASESDPAQLKPEIFAFKPETIDHIVVTASRYEVRTGDRHSYQLINETQLNDSPSFAGDRLRIIHRLPGAASIGISSKPNVRGGATDELLVLFDGVELIEPFHLRDFQSMFSSFNPQTIQNIEYFTGGFPAQYGNKLSGVLDIATQDTFT
ncbi:MAG: Plug domain-containing protein, partial [Proteobacteria bacterium]|nr:Plug domain-containing protein [Pseudomonadota bacterium]